MMETKGIRLLNATTDIELDPGPAPELVFFSQVYSLALSCLALPCHW